MLHKKTIFVFRARLRTYAARGIILLELLVCTLVFGGEKSDIADRLARWTENPSCLISEHEQSNVLSFTDAMLDLYRFEQEQGARNQEDILAGRELRELTQSELKKFYHASDDLLSKDDRRGLEEIRNRVTHIRNAQTEAEKELRAREVAEILAALGNRRRAPFPAQIDLSEFAAAYRKYVNNPIGVGRIRAHNPEGTNPASSFWREPNSIASQNLYYGFNRTSLPELSKSICVYAGPKLGYGRNPGLEVTVGKQKYKVKFADVHCEPFVARIFAALGYNAEPTDYTPSLRIKYDRRIITEFNMRKELSIQVRAFRSVPLCRVQVQEQHDPFAYIVEAVLKDGTRISGRELKSRIFFNSRRADPESSPANFRSEFEEKLDYLITREACIKRKDSDLRSIGPWDYAQLGHEGLRELRGVGLLAGWLGWFDSRYENTRLKIVRSAEGSELRHFFTDLGGALGESGGTFGRHSQDPNAFGWSFTRQARWHEKRGTNNPVRIFGVQSLEETPAFRNMTVDDARWMAQLIGQLTEVQLIQALAASGFDAAEVKLFAEKLLSRRDQMIRDLGLTNEIALLRPEPVDRHFSFDPVFDGPIKVQSQDGEEVVLGSTGTLIEDGRLVQRADAKKATKQAQSMARR